jgi:hypothetical protein
MKPIPSIHGSEFRLSQYFYGPHRAELDRGILNAVGLPDDALSWVYPDEAKDPKIGEFKNLSFLPRSNWRPLLAQFAKAWPQTGKGIRWDGIAWTKNEPMRLILIEAKANQPELCSPPSQASEQSLKKIESALSKTRTSVGSRG